MKTEDFDDAIRRKLTSIDSPHVQQDVEAVHNYVLARMAGSSRRRLAVIIVSVVILAIIGALLTLNMIQVNEIKNLKHTIVQIKNTAQSTELRGKSQSQKTSNPGAGSVNPGIGSANASPHILSANTKNEDIMPAGQKNKHEKNKAAASPVYNKHSNKNMPGVSTAAFVKGPEIINHINASVNADPGAEPLNAPSVRNRDSPVEESQYTALKIPGDSVANSVTRETEAPGNLTIADTLQKSGPAADSAVMQTGAARQAYAKSWRYGVGIGFETGKLQMGIAVLGEAVFKNRWALSAGVKILKNGAETFDDDNDFNKHKKNGFQNTYEHHVNDNANKNIAIRNTVFQIPLSISYILPLGKKFDLLTGVGTDVDIYIKQNVEYEHMVGANDLQNRKFAANYPPVYLNNFVLTAGLQKTIRRFTAQISPYFSPQVKHVDYKKDNLYFGLRFRVFYVFK